jgi:hypothetical protein
MGTVVLRPYDYARAAADSSFPRTAPPLPQRPAAARARVAYPANTGRRLQPRPPQGGGIQQPNIAAFEDFSDFEIRTTAVNKSKRNLVKFYWALLHGKQKVQRELKRTPPGSPARAELDRKLSRYSESLRLCHYFVAARARGLRFQAGGISTGYSFAATPENNKIHVAVKNNKIGAVFLTGKSHNDDKGTTQGICLLSNPAVPRAGTTLVEHVLNQGEGPDRKLHIETTRAAHDYWVNKLGDRHLESLGCSTKRGTTRQTSCAGDFIVVRTEDNPRLALKPDGSTGIVKQTAVVKRKRARPVRPGGPAPQSGLRFASQAPGSSGMD